MAKRKGSAIEYVWRYIPADIWRERDKLVALGVTKLDRKSQQWRQSLGTADRDEAAGKERRLKDDWAREEAEWRRLLSEGPVSLTHTDAIELAAIGALEFFKAHSADPLGAPAAPDLVRPPLTPSDETRAALAAMPVEERRAVYAEGREAADLLVSGTPVEKLRVLNDVREGRPIRGASPSSARLGCAWLRRGAERGRMQTWRGRALRRWTLGRAFSSIMKGSRRKVVRGPALRRGRWAILGSLNGY